MRRLRRTTVLPAFVVLVLLFLPNLASGQRANRKRTTPRIPQRVQKWTKPIREHLPHAAHLVVSSELNIFLTRQVTKVLPALNIAGSSVQMPATSVIFGINAFVFGLWQLAGMFPRRLAPFMENHFLLSGQKRVRRARPDSFLLSGFSHIHGEHLAGNLGALALFGGRSEQWLGTRKFVYMYISSVYASNFMSLGIFGRRNDQRSSLGASGAISALQSYFCLRFPDARFEIAGEKLAAPWAFVLWFLQDFAQLGMNTGIGHGAHLGGFTFGTIFFLFHDIVVAPEHARRRAVKRLALVFKDTRNAVGKILHQVEDLLAGED
ncbi:Presenilins-associated rhomboid-like protein, mitochondrial [Seminavis robusta]|uniref:Presenilins-associated rhomboid-like protein, mitochondrial n=1 Tax=Seminavis robusta TaxID=568900 RepID=A0A9N8DXM3_9STRA|nr:Presenilins-associated rhomboid-like protein, mitochondrial [Seminavis robusta]|eukprot:Sro444_g144410.1 Presenilins-associated rhomboid-like protein, mitochondrial (321) ;mRNA; r:60930-61892